MGLLFFLMHFKMLCAICLNFDQSKIFLSGKGLKGRKENYNNYGLYNTIKLGCGNNQEHFFFARKFIADFHRTFPFIEMDVNKNLCILSAEQKKRSCLRDCLIFYQMTKF